MAAPDAQTAFLSVPCNQLWLFDDVWPPTHVTCTSSGLCPQGRGSDPGPETNAVPADSAGVFAGSLNQHNQTERGARLREGARHVTGDSNAARETPDAGRRGRRARAAERRSGEPGTRGPFAPCAGRGQASLLGLCRSGRTRVLATRALP